LCGTLAANGFSAWGLEIKREFAMQFGRTCLLSVPAFIAGLFALCTTHAAKGAPPPNIVIIMADDTYEHTAWEEPKSPQIAAKHWHRRPQMDCG